jgi:hypothetical protein
VLSARHLVRCLAASAWLACAGPLYAPAVRASDLQIRAEGEGNRVSAALVDGTTRISIRSPSGLGRARIERPGGIISGAVELVLQLQGLEELRISYADVPRVASLPSGDPGAAPRQSARVGEGAERSIGPQSPYWLGVRSGSLGVIVIELPRDFNEREVHSFSLAWVDFFR